MSGHLPSRTAADVVRTLEQAGLVAIHQRGSHRYVADPTSRDIIATVPMHSGDLPRSLLKKIIKDAHLAEDKFRRLL